MICNADEGEPGTFKDRVLLQSYAGRVFEGMAIAGYVAAGAKRAFSICAANIHICGRRWKRSSPKCGATNCSATPSAATPSFSFDIEIHMGAGAYICGEEHGADQFA